MRPVPSAFQRGLRSRRMRLGLSQKDLALLADVPQGTISHLERGTRVATAEQTAKLDEVLRSSTPQAARRRGI